MTRTVRCTVLLALLIAAFVPAAAHAYPQYTRLSTGVIPARPTNEGDCKWCHGDWFENAIGSHGNYSATSDQCDSCHWTMHDTYGNNLLFQTTTTLTCLACHDGTGGHSVYELTSLGLTAGAAHRVEGAYSIPGGDAATGGSRVADLSGAGGQLGCEDCHSPHGTNLVEPYRKHYGRDWQYQDGRSVEWPDSRLLRRQPTGAAAPVPQYGSDWCLTCHQGRSSGGVVHNHPVDSAATTATPYTFADVLVGRADVPIPVAMSSDQAYVFVADVGNRRVQKFTTGGAYVAQWASSPKGRIAALSLVKNVGSDSGRDLFVHDTGDPYTLQVRYLTQNLEYIKAVYEDSSGPFSAVAAGPDGTLAFGFTPSGLLFKMWDYYGADWLYRNDVGMIDAMAVSASGQVYAADSGWNRISVFTPSAHLTSWPSGAAPLPASDALGSFNRPLGVALSPDQSIVYVADSGNDRVQYFTTGGAFLGSWGTTGSGDGQFLGPSGIVVAADRSVWVADSGNHRIQHFSDTGVYLGQFGSRGTGDGQLALNHGQRSSLADRNNGAYLMQEPRLVQQDGHGPVCQQCHADSRDVGDLVNGEPVPTLAWSWPDLAPGAPPYTAFPHQTSLPNLLIEEQDDLCLNCHLPD